MGADNLEIKVRSSLPTQFNLSTSLKRHFFVFYKLVSFDMSSVSTTVAEYIKANGAAPSFSSDPVEFYSMISLSNEYKYLNTSEDNIVFPRGSMMVVRSQGTYGIAVNKTSSLTYSDFDMATSSFINSTSSSSATYTLFFKIHTRAASPVDHSFSLSNVFAASGTYNVLASANLCSNSRISQNVTVTVASGKRYLIRQTPIY